MTILFNKNSLDIQFIWQNHTASQVTGTDEKNENLQEKTEKETVNEKKSVDKAVEQGKINPAVGEKIVKESKESNKKDYGTLSSRLGGLFADLGIGKNRFEKLFGGSGDEENDLDIASIGEGIDTKNLPKNRKAIVQKALDWIKKGTSDGAKNCTNWVTHLYTSLGLPNAESGVASYDGKIVKEKGKYHPTKKAKLSDINKAKPGDYVVIENGNKETGTHGAIVLANLGGGQLKVASLPNANGHPTVDIYNLNSGLDPYKIKSKNGARIGNLARIKAPGSIA